MPATRLPLLAATVLATSLVLATIWLPAGLLIGWTVAWPGKWMLVLGGWEAAAAVTFAALARQARQRERVTTWVHARHDGRSPGVGRRGDSTG